MKLPFRFHRGELGTGFFLLNILTFLNNIVTLLGGIYDEMMYWLNVQFELTTIGSSDIVMRTSDIVGIAAIAGVFPLYFEGGYWTGALHFTESAIFGGSQRSERGLYDTTAEQFDFVHTASDTYADDIVTLSDPTHKMSMVPTGQTIVGYTRADMPVYDADGNIISANVFLTPPVGVAYDVFYGPNFATLSQDALVVTPVGIDFTMKLFIILQSIRYNGPTLQAFIDLTQTICEDAVININIVQGTAGGKNYYVVNYSINPTPTTDILQERVKIWTFVVNQKFKFYELNEVV